MVINSYLFILIFLPLSALVYFTLTGRGKYNIARVFLLGVSLLFYSYKNLKAFPVFIISILFNWALAHFALKESVEGAKRKAVVVVGIVVNLLSLLYFKYLLFFELVTNQLFGTHFAVTSFVVPLGVSYYTFSQIAYLVDCYRDPSIRAEILDYALFVSFFPKITVGPIAFSTEMIPQFNESIRKKADYDNIAKGLYALSLGLAKKVLLADALDKIVEWGYLNMPALGTINAFVVICAYSMQIYFDFSGYCDMASGVCMIFNIDIPENFDSPYKALSINEFWKRWHITLTRFFRKYVYFPLGGNRKGKIRTYLNIMIIFLISGLWHGAAYTFIIWGAIHGVGVCLSKLCAPFMEKVPKFLRRTGTFLFVSLTWVFFRSPDLSCAMDFFEQLFSWKMTPLDINMIAAATPEEMQLMQWSILNFSTVSTYYTGGVVVVLFLLIAMGFGLFAKNTRERVAIFTVSKKTAFVTVFLLVWSIISMSEVTKFIYINF